MADQARKSMTQKPDQAAAPRRGMGKTAATRLGKVPVRSAKGAADPRDTPRTTSTFGPRLEATRKELGDMLASRFPNVEPTFAWNMHGWRIRRPTDIRSWKGTIDPNWILIGVAERKQGMAIHLWNPYDPGCLKKSEPGLKAAGYNVMVGCVNYNRKGDVPLASLAPILDGIRDAMRKETS
ncbi:MAG TPA: hypothetical protein VM286_01065 [Candidatus Thermoplasmatota archaeon]|nr:hypothetical protein [Candidatus Thermoplasmatota archaeon]